MDWVVSPVMDAHPESKSSADAERNEAVFFIIGIPCIVIESAAVEAEGML
jgi:hypothetical protein